MTAEIDHPQEDDQIEVRQHQHRGQPMGADSGESLAVDSEPTVALEHGADGHTQEFSNRLDR